MAVVCLKGCLLNLSRNGVFGDLSNFDFSIFRFLLCFCGVLWWVGFLLLFFFFPSLLGCGEGSQQYILKPVSRC